MSAASPLIRAGQGARIAGFTLIELLVVLAIVALMLTAMPLVISSGQAGARVKAAAFDLADALRAARATAIVNHSDSALALNLVTGKYQVQPGMAGDRLPTGVDARFVGPPSEIRNELVDIRFFPDGSSTGGEISVSMGHIERRISVHWLTGRVVADD